MTAKGAGKPALLVVVPLILLAVALLVWAGIPRVSALGSGARTGGENQSAAVSPIDQRLVLVPRTATEMATVSGVRLELAVGPLLPGANHFETQLAEHGRPLTGAHVLLDARMIGMAMHPITLTMREVQPGRYVAIGPLAMFGQWQITVRIDRPGAAPLGHQFTAGVDLPAGLSTALAAHGAQ